MILSLLDDQKAIFSALNGHISAPVYDAVPKGAVFPYVVIGEATSTDWSTKTNPGEEKTNTVHVWSQKQGYEELKTIMSSIVEKLEAAGFDYEFGQTFPDPDGISKHGVLRFRKNTLQEA